MGYTKDGRMATAAIIVMSSMVLSRLTGFIRETMLSWKVGLSWVQDAYVAAFTVPDLVYMLLVGGTISAALVPFLSGHLERGEEREGWKAASSFINIVFIGLVVFCILGAAFAPWIIPLVAPGFTDKSPQTRELAITLTRILFPSVSFIMLAGICNGVLNSYRKFAAAAYGPSIYNTGCALSIFLFADRNPGSMIKVAFGVALSALVYFIVQLTFALPGLKFYRPVIDLADRGFRWLFKQAVPSLLSSSVTQVNVIVSTAFVSLSIAEGSLAAFRNANTAWQLPYGIFAMGIGTAMLPALSGKYATGDLENYKKLLMRSLSSVLFLSIPSAIGFIILREQIVRAVFKWGGRFTEANVPIVAYILAFFSLAMITQSIVAIMNRAFYACQDTKTPLLAGIVSIILNIGFGSLFYYATDLGAAGMALSYSLISLVNSILLIILLNRKMNGINVRKLFRFLISSLVSSVVMACILLLFGQLAPDPEKKLVQLLYLLLEMVLGSGIYFGVMVLIKSEEALYFLDTFKRKLGGRRHETAE